MTTTIAVVSDIHANSTTAICPPRFKLDDGGEYVASRPQRWLWRQWLSYWQSVQEARAERLIVIINGELGDSLSHDSSQLITKNQNDILRLAVTVLEPMLALGPDMILVTRGTEAHSGLSSWIDEAVAEDIGASGNGTTMSHWLLKVEIDGVRIDAAHHPAGGGGRVPWGRGNFANKLAATAVMQAALFEQPHPHLLLRGHVHRPVDSHDVYPTRAIVTPSWQLTNSYGHRIAGEPLPVGGLIIQANNGQAEVRKIYSQWPIQRYEKL